jgi:hypothetical protein
MGSTRYDFSCHLKSVHARYHSIKNHDVWVQLPHHIERNTAIFCLTANLPFSIRSMQNRTSDPQQRLVCGCGSVERQTDAELCPCGVDSSVSSIAQTS